MAPSPSIANPDLSLDAPQTVTGTRERRPQACAKWIEIALRNVSFAGNKL